MLIISNMGDQVWLMTSRHTEPDLQIAFVSVYAPRSYQTTPPRAMSASERNSQLIDVGMVDPVHKANTR